MLGLFAFFYGSLHFLTYVWLDQFFDAASITKDVVKRPFITVGFAAFLLMVPLALTSTTGWIRRLGRKRWQTLHRLVYVTAVLGVVHYWWLVKADISRPLTYGAIVAHAPCRAPGRSCHAEAAARGVLRRPPVAPDRAARRHAMNVRTCSTLAAPRRRHRAPGPCGMRVQLDDRPPAPHREQRPARDLPDRCRSTRRAPGSAIRLLSVSTDSK